MPLHPPHHYAPHAASFAPMMHYGIGMTSSYAYHPAAPIPMQPHGWAVHAPLEPMPMYGAAAAGAASVAPPGHPSLSQMQQLTHEQSMQLHHQRMQQQHIEMEQVAAHTRDMQAFALMQQQQQAAMMQQQLQQQLQQQQQQHPSHPALHPHSTAMAPPLTKPPIPMMPTHMYQAPSPGSGMLYSGVQQWQQHPMQPVPMMYSHAPPPLQPRHFSSHFSSSSNSSSSSSSGGGMYPGFAAFPGEPVMPFVAPVYAQSDSSLSSPDPASRTRSSAAEPVLKLELPSSAGVAMASGAPLQALPPKAVSGGGKFVGASIEMPIPVRVSASNRKRRRRQHATETSQGAAARLHSPAAAGGATGITSDDSAGSLLLRLDSRRMSKPTRERILQDAFFNSNIECGVRPSRWPPASAATHTEEESSPAATTAAVSSSSSGSTPPGASPNSAPAAAAAATAVAVYASAEHVDDEGLDDEGYVIRTASDRVYSAYSSFFGGVVEMFVASADPYPGRILFRAAALAHKAGCSLNRVAMYLARQRGSEAGIFQALSFSRKLRGCPGLKRGGYFVSVLACEMYLERCKVLTHRKFLTPTQFKGVTTPGEAPAPTASKTRAGGLMSALSTAAAAAASAGHDKDRTHAAAAAAAAAASAAGVDPCSGSASPASTTAAAPATHVSAASASPLVFSRWQLYLGLDECGAGECTYDFPVDSFPPRLRQQTTAASTSPAAAAAASLSPDAARCSAVALVAAQDRSIELYLRHRLHQWTESFTARLAGLNDDERGADDAGAEAEVEAEAEAEEEVTAESEEEE